VSDLDGERAFDMIVERMLDLQIRLDRAERAQMEAQNVRFTLEQQVKNLEGRMHSAAADACRFRALVPPDVLKEHETSRSAAWASPAPAPAPDNDFPF
jgi:hypothetical protein